MEKDFVVCEGIEGLSYDIGKYLYSLLASISNVDSSYIHYDGNNKDEDFDHVERVFAYELYHQWCNYPLIKNNRYIVVNAEIPKNLISDARHKMNLMYPDMVLHHGQNAYKGNLIVCEIKRDGYATQHQDKVRDDLIKLRTFLSEDLKVKTKNTEWEPFEIAVFVLTVSKDTTEALSVSKILTLLDKQYLEEIKAIEKKYSERIYCVVYNGKELKYDTLFNMIEGK